MFFTASSTSASLIFFGALISSFSYPLISIAGSISVSIENDNGLPFIGLEIPYDALADRYDFFFGASLFKSFCAHLFNRFGADRLAIALFDERQRNFARPEPVERKVFFYFLYFSSKSCSSSSCGTSISNTRFQVSGSDTFDFTRTYPL